MNDERLAILRITTYEKDRILFAQCFMASKANHYFVLIYLRLFHTKQDYFIRSMPIKIFDLFC